MGEESMLGSLKQRGGTNARADISFTVGTTGLHTLRLSTDAKNAASSNNFGYLVWLRLVKQ